MNTWFNAYIWGSRLSASFNVSTFVLIVYDTIICFSSECSLIWNRPFGLVASSYLAARYGFLCFIAMYIGFVAGPFPITYFVGARIPGIAAWISLGVAMVGTQTLILLRTTAISGRNLVFNGILLLIGIGSWTFYMMTVVRSNFSDVLAAAWIGSLFDGYFNVFSVCNESLIIAATVYYSWNYLIARRHSGTAYKGTLTELLVKQGILRYSITLFWSILIISAEFSQRNHDDVVQISPYTALIVSSTSMSICVSVILICRMILELRKFSRRPNNTSRTRSDNRHTSTILRFTHRMHRDVVDEFVDSLMDADDEIEGLSSSSTSRSLEDGNCNRQLKVSRRV